MKQIDNRQKQLKQLKAQKGHLLPFRDKSHVHTETSHFEKEAAGNQEKIKEEKNKSPEGAVQSKKIGRNEPCPCGSGKKYKKCCLNAS